MAFIDDGFQNASPFIPNASNFLASDPNTFLFDPDAEFLNMSGWRTFWTSTFAPKKYRRERDAEVKDDVVKQYNVKKDSSCETLNSKIDKMESRFDSEAKEGKRKRGATRMQARVLKALEPELDKAYKYADEKCCEGSVCAIKKTMGRDPEDDQGGGDTSLSSREQIKAELMAEMVNDPILGGYTPPNGKKGMNMGTKIGLGVGGLLILMMMGYMVFKGGNKGTSRRRVGSY